MSALDDQVGGDHYRQYKIQPVEFIVANDIPYIEARCIEYLLRWRQKGGVETLRKVQHYVEILIELQDRGLTAAQYAAMQRQQDIADEP